MRGFMTEDRLRGTLSLANARGFYATDAENVLFYKRPKTNDSEKESCS